MCEKERVREKKEEEERKKNFISITKKLTRL